MASSIDRYRSEGALGAPSAPPAEASAAELSFGGAGLGVGELQALLPRSAQEGEQIAAEVCQLNQVRRSGNAYWSQRWVWRMTPSDVCVFDLRQDLQRRADGKFRTLGAWRLHGQDRWAFAKPPSRREGELASAAAAGPDAASIAASERDDGGLHPPAGQAGLFAEGTEAMAYLPGIVQAFCRNAIPQPVFFHGNIWQHADERHSPSSMSISLLRLDAERAVCIHATKSIERLGLAPRDGAEAQRLIAAQPWWVVQSWGDFASDDGGRAAIEEAGR